MSQKDYYILAINPGSTSMKLAIYRNENRLHDSQFNYSAEQIAPFELMIHQLDMRRETVMTLLESLPISMDKLSAVVGRGGVIVPVKSGAYEVNELMVNRLKNRPLGQHASNLGGLLAYEVAQSLGIPAYVYDGVTVGELAPLALLTGLKGVIRQSRCHALNMRAMAIKSAQRMGKDYNQSNIIVAHMGGGITLSIHEKGRMSDAVLNGEGPFSPERSGRLSLSPLIAHCIKHGLGYKELQRKTRGGGGLVSLIGTNNALEVEKRIDHGDILAALAYETIAYQVAKGIGELATVVNGQVDKIVLTGAIANSQRIVDWITKRVGFIADVDVIPGEDELESLALGALRVLRQEESAHIYDKATDDWDMDKALELALQEFRRLNK